MSEVPRIIRATMLTAGVLGSSVLGACSADSEPKPDAASTEQSSTLGEQEAPTTSTTEIISLNRDELPRSEEAIVSRAYDLWYAGLQEVRNKYAEQGKIDIAFGLCVSWEAAGGYSMIANPGYYEFETDTERFSFIVFSFGETDEGLPPESRVSMMNGPLEYSQKDANGNIIPGTHFAVDIKQRGTPVGLEADVTTMFRNGTWGLRAESVGEDVIVSKVIPSFNQTEFDAFCAENVALTLPLAPDGPI